MFIMDRDEKEIAALMKAEKDFWDRYVMTGKTPPADGQDATSAAINEMFQNAGADVADLRGFDSIFKQRAELQKQIKNLKEAQADLDNQIKLAMGSACKGICGGWTVSWRMQDTGGLDREAIKKDFPGLDFKKYAKAQTRALEAFVIGSVGIDHYGIRIPRQDNQTEYKNRYVVASENELRRIYKHGTN